MADLGYFAILLCLFLGGYGIIADLLGAWRGQIALMTSGRNALMASFMCLSVAIVALCVLLVGNDFGIEYVAAHTSKDLPLVYRMTALWAGAAGSLLFWLWLQVGIGAWVFHKRRSLDGSFASNARVVVNLVSVFFLLVLIFDKNPFAASAVPPADGAGLNPLLQHPAMVLHPPTLFIGYAALIVPFAWTFADIKMRGPNARPLAFAQCHRWLLFAWMLLTIGIGLGAWWAYEELGWGGYWAWDPVENSSLLPWLTATALLHCARTYRRNTATAVWFAVLSILTFSLCVFGTFLTRYGLVSSVHAFPEPGLGVLFLVLLIHIWVFAFVLWFRRWRQWKGNTRITGAVGERYIILNNWLMVLLTLVIFLGTLFPFLSGLFSDRKISLQAEYFTKITSPGGLLLLLLLGICPHLLRRGLRKDWRAASAVVGGAAALIVWLVTRRLAPVYLVLCGLVAVNLTADLLVRFARSAKRKDRTGWRPRLRWGAARAVHFGVLLVFVGLAGSGGYDIEEEEISLRPDGRTQIGRYELVFKDLNAEHGPNFTAVTAEMEVYEADKQITTLYPSRAVYPASGQNTSEVDVRRTLAGDLYLALTYVDPRTEQIKLTAMVKPLINWIWIGSIISVLGTALVIVTIRSRPSLPEDPHEEQE